MGGRDILRFCRVVGVRGKEGGVWEDHCVEV